MNTFPHYLNQNKQIFYRNASNQKLLKVEKSSPIKTTHQLQFELLNIFYIVTICGSICLASERLGMTQPAISLSLNKLEKHSFIASFEFSPFKVSIFDKADVIVENKML